MSAFDFSLDDSMIGQTIGPVNGFVTNLSRTAAGPYEQPQFNEGRQRWVAGRFVLRGSNDYRDLICLDSQSGGGWTSGTAPFAIVLANASIGYAGGLEIVAVPKGSTWALTLSDAPTLRRPPQPWDLSMFVRPREAELVRR
jgi:hypothetical protein